MRGGYGYAISDDLSKREGENRTSNTQAWVEPPATPAVGMAYLQAYQLTGEQYLLDAALETANCLVDTQLVSGGCRTQSKPIRSKNCRIRIGKIRRRILS